MRNHNLLQTFLDTRVASDWRQQAELTALRRMRWWRGTQIAIALTTTLVLMGLLLWPTWPWHVLSGMVLLNLVFWMLPLGWVAQGSGRRGLLSLLVVGGIVLLASWVAYNTAPMDLKRMTSLNPWPVLLSATIPLLTWPILIWTRQRRPGRALQLGLVTEHWFSNAVVGVAIGAAMGLHLLITSDAMPALSVVGNASPQLLTWALFTLIGLRSLGEELLFRGLAYHTLMQDGENKPWRVGLSIVLLNMFVFLIPAMRSGSLPGMALLLAYGALLAGVTTSLRHRQQSLVPGLACNVVFGLFTAPMGML